MQCSSLIWPSDRDQVHILQSFQPTGCVSVHFNNHAYNLFDTHAHGHFVSIRWTYTAYSDDSKSQYTCINMGCWPKY